MAKEDKKVTRQRFDEIMGVAKKHHLASLLKENKDDENFEISDLRYAMEELGPAFIKLGQLLATRPDMVGNEIADDLICSCHHCFVVIHHKYYLHIIHIIFILKMNDWIMMNW